MPYLDTDYIYIFLVILYFIYNVIQAGKKISKEKPTITKKQPSHNTPDSHHKTSSQEEKKEDVFKKVLEELFGEIPNVEVPQKQVPTPQARSVDSKPDPVKVIPGHPQKEIFVSSKAKGKKINEAEKTQKEFKPHPEVVQMAFAEDFEKQEETTSAPPFDFDIRQAVIYSEILKRPQY